METAIIDNAKVMSKGQITLPKEIRKALNIGAGDKVTLIYENGQVRMMKSAVYAMKVINSGLFEDVKGSDLNNEKDINAFVKEVRSGGNDNK